MPEYYSCFFSFSHCFYSTCFIVPPSHSILIPLLILTLMPLLLILVLLLPLPLCLTVLYSFPLFNLLFGASINILPNICWLTSLFDASMLLLFFYSRSFSSIVAPDHSLYYDSIIFLLHIIIHIMFLLLLALLIDLLALCTPQHCSDTSFPCLESLMSRNRSRRSVRSISIRSRGWSRIRVYLIHDMFLRQNHLSCI